MRVSCPSCDAVYDVPDSVLASGARPLRCARCAHEWIPVAEVSEPPPQVDPIEAADETMSGDLDMPKPPPILVASPPLTQERGDLRRQSAPLVAAAWALSVVVLAGLGTAAYVFRDSVEAAWPPSQVVYAALGLA